MRHQDDSIGGLLRGMREAAELTQGELSERIALSRPTISQLETGQRLPRIDTMRDWAAACGYRADLVISRESDDVGHDTLARSIAHADLTEEEALALAYLVGGLIVAPPHIRGWVVELLQHAGTLCAAART